MFLVPSKHRQGAPALCPLPDGGDPALSNTDPSFLAPKEATLLGDTQEVLVQMRMFNSLRGGLGEQGMEKDMERRGGIQ